MKRGVVIAALLVAGCHPKVSPEVLQQWQSRTLYTCCNIHYEGQTLNDANYYVGSTLAFGSPAVVEEMTDQSVTFNSGTTKLTLLHAFGTQQETGQQYFDKILVQSDPHLRYAAFPKAAQAAISDSRVERGMTREQVLMSVGYPPTHRTASTNDATWTYWYNRWKTYQVMFDDSGVVVNIVGDAPTRNDPVVSETPKPTPVPARKRRG